MSSPSTMDSSSSDSGSFGQTELDAHTAGNFSDYDLWSDETILTGCCYLPIRLQFSETSKRLNVCCGGHIKMSPSQEPKIEGAFIQRGDVDM